MKLRKRENKKEDLTDIVDKITENFNEELDEEVKEVEEFINDETEEVEVKEIKKESVKPIKKEKEEPMKRRTRKKFKIDISIIVFIAVLLLAAGIVIFLTIGNGGSKYGERLKGIEKISFTKKEKNKLVDELKKNENVTSASLDIQGKIIYIIFNVKEEVSLDDAKNIGNESLNNLSDAIKGYYDINVLITKKNEKGTEESKLDADGNEKKVIHKEFPISGYKKNSSDHIVW
ncbi:MAG: hypothetical protein IKP98_04175 [Bacilli bacterium]|nr:hypothetical protein [Bacilli bacterium]